MTGFALIALAVPSNAVPSSDYSVGLHMDEYYIRMQVSTEKDTVYVVPGWVDINDMRMGETVSVKLSCTGYADLYAGPDPPHLIFERDGRQFFNLTITLLEDAPIDYLNEILLTADAKTYLDQAMAYAELTVEPIYEISATARVVNAPARAAPGEETTGVLKVTNTGTIYGEYYLTKASDPDKVVDEISFARSREAELTPGFYDDFDFRIKIADDAPPGKHRVTIDLWATTQYDTGGSMDTFTITVTVTEEPVYSSGTVTVAILLVIALLAIATYMLRRKP